MFNVCCSTKECYYDFEVTYDNIGDEIICPECNQKYEVRYDEYWDEETGEEDSWWWLEEIK